jgi:DNA-binding response OmpR family regulator
MARILLLEDDALQAKLATLYLQHYGHEVLNADDAEPQRLAASHRIELVIAHVDRALRGQQAGATLLADLRRASPVALKVLAICDAAGDDSDVRCQQGAASIGADCILVRPYPLEQLRVTVGALLG